MVKKAVFEHTKTLPFSTLPGRVVILLRVLTGVYRSLEVKTLFLKV